MKTNILAVSLLFLAALALAERLIAGYPEQRVGHDFKAFAERALARGGSR